MGKVKEKAERMMMTRRRRRGRRRRTRRSMRGSGRRTVTYWSEKFEDKRKRIKIRKG
jgi:hypothetical protein